MNNKLLACLTLAIAIIGCSKKDDTAAPTASVPAAPTATAAPAAPAPIPTPTVSISPAPEQLTIKTPDAAPAVAIPTPTVSVPAAPVPTTPAAPVPAPSAPAPSAPTGAGTLTVPAIPSLSDLSSDQLTGGLKEALGKGLQSAVSNLGKPGGFLANPDVKIPMPDELKSVESTLRTLGQGALADQFVTTMNSAAEQAVPAAASVFANSLKGMTVADATKLLTGPDDAATQYFRKATEGDLTQQFLPIVKQATSSTGATKMYKEIIDKAKSVNPFFDNPSLDLDSYVTSKSMDGLFKMVAAEEKNIRANPVARSSDLLKSVFGALKK